MIDHLLGRPSVSWKRTQVFLVTFFWMWRISNGEPNPRAPRILSRLNKYLKRYSPWQIILSTLTIIYGARNLDSILGLSAPEPLARLYSRSYYRATWINVALEAGFATAMNVKPKWLRDICSMLFSLYYLFYANAADEKLRKYRATCTVETLRVTWEKTGNPYLRLITYFERPRLPVARQILLPRPASSKHRKPITAWLFWSRPEAELETATDLILDIPGGGFICLGPKHHEERLRRWAQVSRRPVLSIDYGKAPEYPYPWAIEECFDVYQVLADSQGAAIGMSGKLFNVIMTGDSAGANIICGVMFKILESSRPIQHPSALVFNYACLDFNFGSWMTPANLRVLKAEASSSHIPGLEEQKAHTEHRSPLSVVRDVNQRRIKKRKSWSERLSFTNLSRLSSTSLDEEEAAATPRVHRRPILPRARTVSVSRNQREDDDADDEYYPMEEHEKPIIERVLYTAELVRQRQPELEVVIEEERTKALEASKTRGGTRLTMTSRSGYFADRIITPAMMRAMAILYLGLADPDFERDYYISPILAPSSLLARFPSILMTCGEKDPFVDDTVIFAGRIREAKRALRAKVEMEVAGKSARFGEGLRMSNAVPEMSISTSKSRLLYETEEDWVQMEIFEGWSHGYLLMPSLMGEAREAIVREAEWIDGAFVRYGRRLPPPALPDHARSPVRPSMSPTVTSPRRGKQYKPDLGNAVVSSETETETEGLIMPSRRRRSPPPSFGSGTTERPVGPAGAAGSPRQSGYNAHNGPHGSNGANEPTESSAETLVAATPAGKVATNGINEAELIRRRRAEAAI